MKSMPRPTRPQVVRKAGSRMVRFERMREWITSIVMFSEFIFCVICCVRMGMPQISRK